MRYLEKLHSIGENIDDSYTLNWKKTPAADNFMAVFGVSQYMITSKTITIE